MANNNEASMQLRTLCSNRVPFPLRDVSPITIVPLLLDKRELKPISLSCSHLNLCSLRIDVRVWHCRPATSFRTLHLYYLLPFRRAEDMPARVECMHSRRIGCCLSPDDAYLHPSARAQSPHRTAVPCLWERRKKSNLGIMTLQKHFSYTSGSPKVRINLKEILLIPIVNVEQIDTRV